MFRKTIPVGRIIPPFFLESSESDRVFNYLYDSNSIFRARRINSEWVSGGTVKGGTSAVLLQTGLNENWLADSMERYTYLRNVQDLWSDGKTPDERRFGKPFKGPIVPFGSLVEYYTISAKDQSRIHQCGKKVLPGLFLGYALCAARIWKGDILVADLEELETMDASEIYSKRLNAKEVIFPKENGKFIFPAADGRIKTLGNTSGSRYALQDKQGQSELGDSWKTNETQPKLRVSWKPVNPHDCKWKNLYRKYHEDHIAGKGRQFTAALQFGTKIISYASSHEDSRSKSSSGQRMGET